MWILDKIRGKVGKPKVELEGQEKPDDIGITKQQEEIAEKVGSVYRMTSKNLLAREEQEVLLETLQKRFLQKTRIYKTVVGIKWQDVQKKLEANPEKLWSLNEMERTGGEPNVISYDEKTAEYIFMDCSAESPIGRRNCVYDREAEENFKKKYPAAKNNGNAVDMAELMGIDLLTESEYRELQSKGHFDKYSWNWLKTPDDKRKGDVALYGEHHNADAYIGVNGPANHYNLWGFRGSLRV